ncbi:MAG: tetratricopeptide repeat protein [Acidobacteriota bacterium]|nr:tetratricopeptide repeat protein [Acidobacteriota bacterium]
MMRRAWTSIGLATMLLSPAARAQTVTGADPLAQAKSYIAKDMLPAAETDVRSYLRGHANSAIAHFLLGYILFRQTKARESLAEYTAGAKYQMPSAADLRVVGADYVILSDFGDADKWFSKATELDPGNVLGWYYLGRTKYNENRFEEALSAFKTCLKLAPNHVRAEDNLGLTLQGLGRYDEAEQAFQNAIDWQANAPSKDPWPFIDMGSMQLENNHPEKAIPYLQQAIAMVPNSPKAHQQLGKSYLALHDFSKAKSELEEAIKLAPDSAPGHYILGQLYQKQGQSEKAKQEFALYTKLNSANSKEDSREYQVAAPN